MNKPRFRLLLTKEADDFMQSLPLKARDKMYYNIRESRWVIWILKYSRSWKILISGSFAHCLAALPIVCSLSGTPRLILW